MRSLYSLVIVFLGVGLWILGVPFAATSAAESYVAGQIGATFPQNMDSVQTTGTNGSNALTGVQLKNSIMYGGKAGYYFNSLSLDWLGVEADVMHTTPHMKQHGYTINGPGGPTSVSQGMLLGVTTLGFKLMLRTPRRDMDRWFEPYVGAGPAIFFANLNGPNGSSSDTAIGFNLALGSRFYVSKSLAFFTELKMNSSATFSFNNAISNGTGIRGDYAAYFFATGLSYHFGGK